MAEESIYLTIEGVKQGNISAGANTQDSMGNKYQSDHTDEITVHSFDHGVMRPYDPSSGQAEGQRVHSPATFSKGFDKTSPMLYQACCTGERLTKCEFKWYRAGMDGGDEHFFTHVLHDALIVSINAGGDSESVSLTYRQMDWTQEVAGTAASDNWREA
jgi:type VI secretion system secreted protein Hcp